MSVKSIRQALEVALGTWATDNNIAVSWQNVAYTPIIGTKYIRASLLPAETQNPSLGDNHKRYEGIFQLLLCLPDGNGSYDTDTLADSLLNYFARGQSFTVSSVTVRILESPSVNPSFADAGWYTTPVSIRYTADIY